LSTAVSRVQYFANNTHYKEETPMITVSLHTLASPTTRRERWAWYLYDFGNSAYAAVVLLAVYSAYFQGAVVGSAEGSRLWGLAAGIQSVSRTMVSFFAPPGTG
jgi:MFS-type transporter involved in bile tolerance (Atg22 family)